MKKSPFIPLLLIAIFILSSCSQTKPLCKPEKKVRTIKFKGFVNTIKGKVDFIFKDGDSVEITVKHKRQYNNRGYDYLVAKFPSPINDSIKIGKILTLYRNDPKKDSCDYVFKPIKK